MRFMLLYPDARVGERRLLAGCCPACLSVDGGNSQMEAGAQNGEPNRIGAWHSSTGRIFRGDPAAHNDPGALADP
jgi:hypothetical protein